MTELKKTILFENHQKLGANMVEFGGFSMPLYYTTIALEHQAVRNEVGMFDVSHMGEIVVKGPDALAFVNYVLSSKVEFSNKMQYGILLNDKGGAVDDLMAYVFHPDHVLLVVNASNKDKDFKYLESFIDNFNVELFDETDACGEIALQGPKSFEVLSSIFRNLPQESMKFDLYSYEGHTVLISRSGYTGEDGFEIYADLETTIKLWDKLYKSGVTPCGLGCRDTLRFEAAMPLYGHELAEDINPIEAGLTFALDLSKENFIGKDALVKYKENPKRKIVGIELLERNVARQGYEVYHNDTKIGVITTGYLSPTTQLPIALALIDINYAKIGTELNVLIRNKMIPAKVRDKKFYHKKNKI
ncbi:glycine cleavage system aminomethyltransferase GcvT [Acholeplasma hippikon]|uniref:Aminomethyltransferase n=1 Tax=Acholeplasma hippikon TaxID=264636 RepID=A0A449BJJ7_9MOLU|nr:glycine cleavage system aminomethyltransferase GcvT [Acholeplasma hippikon]VEU82608.1 Aminomethyltransferase [Acholeplasma hippikon]